MTRRSLLFIILGIPLIIGILFTMLTSINKSDESTEVQREEIVFYPGEDGDGIHLTAEGRSSFTDVVSNLGDTDEPENLLDPPDAPVACRYSVYSQSDGREIQLYLTLYKGERLATIENVPLVGTVTKEITDDAYQKLTHPEPWLEK